MRISAEAIAEIAERPLARVEPFAEAIQEVVDTCLVADDAEATLLRAAHFLAQVLHESARLRYTKEVWGPTTAQLRYEGRRDLGNTEPGDGYRYRGRGIIQCTGRSNYARFTRYCREQLGLDVDFVAAPELLSELPWSVLVACWYWTIRSLNIWADADDLMAVTKRVNGGFNGLADRQRLLSRAKNILQAEAMLVDAREVAALNLQYRTAAELRNS